MKLRVMVSTDDFGYPQHEAFLDGIGCGCVFTLWECPKDACIGRSLMSFHEISELMKKANEAGLHGEKLDIEFVNI